MQLTKVSETSTAISFSWTPPADAELYVFYAAGSRVSTGAAISKTGTVKNSITFYKAGEPYEVVCLTEDDFSTDVGRYPNNVAISKATGVVQ